MLGVCILDMQFVFIFPDWEGSVADGRVLQDAQREEMDLKCLMKTMSTSSALASQSLKGTKRKWNYHEDVVLVSALIDLHNVGKYNVDSGFRGGYLLELENRLTTKLPDANLKAKPHIESRIKTLKKEWAIIYDMVQGTHTSGFGWDDQRNMVVADDPVWESYIHSHKEVVLFRRKSFPFFNKLSLIYARDRVTGKDAQTAVNILEEMQDRNDTINEETEGENLAGYNFDDEDFSNIQSQTLAPISETTSARKKKRLNETGDPITFESIIAAATILGEIIKEVGIEFSKSVGAKVNIQQKAQELDEILSQVERLTVRERVLASIKLPKSPTFMFVFFSINPDRRLEWLRTFLADR
ncbi:PREDICTED: uncharacterized protein At2g29880 [Theobroma cacao]|uniref:Uncharacterized protein At2g29880 n=1 Tax=Theobroma cacao TaxID=3641 RepID=A0AB32VS03_THECC|nr:PREDICTED: uncharacterized protein At2g29880 [Theobroma cacao]